MTILNQKISRNSHLKIKDIILLFFVLFLIVSISIILNEVLNIALHLIALFTAVGFILLVLLDTFRRIDDSLILIHEEAQDNYKQIEAMFSLFSIIKPTRPFPPLRHWVISPDLANIIVSHVLENKPKCVVECSSGVSTLIIAYCLRKLGNGKVYSLEHDEEFAKITTENIRLHGLEDYAAVVHAPLTKITVNGNKYHWFNIDGGLTGIKNIDFLFVDGPPLRTQRLARYPCCTAIEKHVF